MKPCYSIVLSLIFSFSLAWGDQAPKEPSVPDVRQWTSRDGKKITAAYLGVRKDQVALKLQDGKISFYPFAGLSDGDRAFIRIHRFDYRAPWNGWPQGSTSGMGSVNVTEEASGSGRPGAFVYKIPHFRFISDVNLGTVLMRDLARVFELTHRLQSMSPLGTLATPENGLFEARLFGATASYMAAGGPRGTAGVYLLKEKVFMAPLDLMGIRESPAGWRKEREGYDLSTVVHELTHLLTHGMLENLPTWVNEGYAEYISKIPLRQNAFLTNNDQIRDGVIDTLMDYSQHLSGISGSQKTMPSAKERREFLKNGLPITFVKVEKVLTMSDGVWARGERPPVRAEGVPGLPFPVLPGGPAPVSGVTGLPFFDDPARLPRLYRTAHLIIYYFIQIEGERGVQKIRRFLESNEKQKALYDQYAENFKIYETRVKAFKALPGVRDLGDGKIQYPANLSPPKAPQAPFLDPDTLRTRSLTAFLDGESASAVGSRIEGALRQDLRLPLIFE